MPIVEKAPWCEQYFAGVACPAGVYIPTDDALAWQRYPKHRWVYNRLLLCETQGIVHAPHVVTPAAFPVLSLPICDLGGTDAGRLIHSASEYARALTPGHCWMSPLDGEHLRSEVAVIDGEPRWWRHSVGVPLVDGMYDYWTVLAEARERHESRCGEWLRRHLAGYTGCVILAAIGSTLIGVHLRVLNQWPDLHETGWLDAVVRLYAEGRWQYREPSRRQAYSVELYVPHGRGYDAPPSPIIERLLSHPAIASIQITFDPDRPAERRVAMPPGGFRLAIVNAWDREAGMQARAELAAWFGRDTGRVDQSEAKKRSAFR